MEVKLSSQRRDDTAIAVIVLISTVCLSLAVYYRQRITPPPHSCEYYLTGAGTYNDSLIIKRDSASCK